MRLVLKLNVSILILYDITFTNMSMNVVQNF
jgi:hypothetical protein